MKNFKFILCSFSFLLLGSLYSEPLILYTQSSTDCTEALPELELSFKEQIFVNHVQQSIVEAEKANSKLDGEILNLQGMSSSKNRHLLNNLCSLPETHYLEIGCWKGSTFISALFKNNESIKSARGIDDWSSFGGPKQEFISNSDKHLSDINFNFHSIDCFSVAPESYITDKINIYFYDGGHTQQEQSNAFTFFNDVFDDVFIAIVDDWNWGEARQGTFNAFSKLNYKILYEVSLPADFNGDVNKWWNGLYIAVIRK